MNTPPGAWITFPATGVSRYILRAFTLLIKSQHMKGLNSSNKFKVLIKNADKTELSNNSQALKVGS